MKIAKILFLIIPAFFTDLIIFIAYVVIASALKIKITDFDSAKKVLIVKTRNGYIRETLYPSRVHYVLGTKKYYRYI